MIYNIGLIVVILTILISIDDLMWDLFFFFLKLFGKVKDPVKITKAQMLSVPPKMMALIIAAYREEDVIEEVLRNIIATNQYPYEMYHIFVGVYPNDPDTTQIIEKLSEEFEHVHPVVHYLQGPSSKADNINNVLDYTRKFEKENRIEFQFYVIHDSEDVVHPYEFLLENYLLEKHQAIQIPVFPIQEKPTFRNIIPNMITGTYADEFAENHYQTMQIRNSINAFVPSAGTGFALSREIIDSFDGEVFPVGSLTEDYKLSLQLKRKGFHLYFPLEYFSRVNFQEEEVVEYIATRSLFPRTYKAAVRQKTRWIHGITMQSFRLRDLIWDKNLNLQTRYSFYKDWKAKFGNLLVLPSYLVFIYFILSLFMDLPTMYPKYSFSWYMMVCLTLIMIHRQFIRYRALNNIYGSRTATIATLLPPLLPIRLVVGNVINFHATVLAWRNHLLGNRKQKAQKERKLSRRKRKIAWSKTDHEFLDPSILNRYRMRVGDLLISEELIAANDLKYCLDISRNENRGLRTVILENNYVEERALLSVISRVLLKTYYDGSLGNFVARKNYYGFDFENLKALQVVPLFVTSNTVVLLTTVDFDFPALKDYFRGYSLEIICSSESNIETILNGEETDPILIHILESVSECLDKGFLSATQALIALSYSDQGRHIDSIFKKMGLLVCDEMDLEGMFKYRFDSISDSL